MSISRDEFLEDEAAFREVVDREMATRLANRLDPDSDEGRQFIERARQVLDNVVRTDRRVKGKRSEGAKRIARRRMERFIEESRDLQRRGRRGTAQRGDWALYDATQGRGRPIAA